MGDQHIQVLFIEDCDTDYEILKRCLGRTCASFDMHRVENLSDGLELLSQTGRFDIVLTDLTLPDSTGLETVRAIRGHDPSIAIVVLTGHDDGADALEALSFGAQDYLQKGEATAHALERSIRHSMQRQENLVEVKRLLNEVKVSREMLSEQTELLESKNRRLRKLYKTAHRFVDNVSHEFRTPLTVIKDFVTLVREGMVGPVNEEQVRMLDIAGVRADDLNNMVDDMLDVSKLESGLLGAWRRNCQVQDLVNSIRPALEKKAEVKKIAFEIAVHESLPQVYCDSEKVGRVIINLVANAMKFCGEPGVVRLWAKHDADRQEILMGVTDNGSGMDEEGVSEIFKRFKQLRNNVKSSTKGFGLGLNIAKELVDLNFGDMYVESQLDRGSTFSFTIPIAEPMVVLPRYLERLRQRRNGPSMVSLVSAHVAGETPTEETEDENAKDLDAFFNYLLRRTDLLFRSGDRRWLFVLPTPRSQLQRFLERAQDEFEKTNRNRPYGPLPPFQMDIEGCWRVATCEEKILESFQTQIEGDLVYA